MDTGPTPSDRTDDCYELSFGLADAAMIRDWSSGEVTRPTGLDPETLLPEDGGIFCERVFGPVRNWECCCGQYRGRTLAETTCEACGVIVAAERIRRQRSGHIELAAPVVHPWFYRCRRSSLARLLHIPARALHRVIEGKLYLVENPGAAPVRDRQRISPERYQRLKAEHGDSFFTAGTGAAVVLRLLTKLGTLSGDQHPASIVLTVLPVIPAGLRPPRRDGLGEVRLSRLNAAYLRVLRANVRLREVLFRGALEGVVHWRERQLRHAVNALFDALARRSGRGEPTRGPNAPLGGGWRGRRVPFSTRSVLVPDPGLKPHQCGIPAGSMAPALFRPLLLRQLQDLGYRRGEREALLRQMPPLVCELLRKVMQDHPVLISVSNAEGPVRLLAFEPVLIAGSAVHVHPLVCGAFGDEGGGSDVTVYLTLSEAARGEAALLMAPGPLRSSANGSVAAPPGDVVLGCADLTAALGGRDGSGERGEGMVFSGIGEVLSAFDHGRLGVHATITVRLPIEKSVVSEVKDEKGTTRTEAIPRKPNGLVLTTVGRVIFNDILHPKMAFYDLPLRSEHLRRILADCEERLGRDETVALLGRVAKIAFRRATKSGLTLAVSDLPTPENKESVLRAKEIEVEKYRKQLERGLITVQECYNKVIDCWTEARDQIAKCMLADLANDRREGKPRLNPIYLMAHSGARGGVEQVRRMAGMWGLVVSRSGSILDMPIRSNLREGLKSLEYFLSVQRQRQHDHTIGRRRRKADRLHRRLIAAAQDVVVTGHDCGTSRGVYKGPLADRDMYRTQSAATSGRICCRDIRSPYSGEVVVAANTLVTPETADQIEWTGVTKVLVRSPMTCEMPRGICRLCYGADPATGDLVEVGTAVGLIAAQILGEPARHLVERQFFLGRGPGWRREPDESQAVARRRGKVRFAGLRYATDGEGRRIALAAGAIELLDWGGQRLERFSIPVGAELLVADGQETDVRQELARWDPGFRPIVTEHAGRVRFVDLVEGRTVMIQRRRTDGERREVVPTSGPLDPRLRIEGELGEILAIYPIVGWARLEVRDGQAVVPGTVLARGCDAPLRRAPWIGGLDLVVELFSLRLSRQKATLARCAGVVRLGEKERGQRSVYVRPIGESGELVEEVEHWLPEWSSPSVSTGSQVETGEPLTYGDRDPYDVEQILGTEAAQEYLLEELRTAYRACRFEINDKHIEIVVARMFGKGSVRNAFGPATDRLRGIEVAGSENPLFAGGLVPTPQALVEAALAGRRVAIESPRDHILLGRLAPLGTGVRGESP